MVTARFLAHVEMFRGVPINGLSRLARKGRLRSFPIDATLMHQGDIGDCLYVIVSGKVRVERSHPLILEPVVLAELGPGEVVGEMGLLDGDPRSATVKAIEPTDALRVAAEDVADILARYPDVTMALLTIFSKRLRTTNDLVAQMTERRPEPVSRTSARAVKRHRTPSHSE